MAPININDAKRIIIKIGSALLVEQSSGRLRKEWLSALADDIAFLRREDKDIILVSSGSIALGRHVLGFSAPFSLEQSQAAAATGQIKLARAYEDVLEPHGLKAAQVLLTLEDTKSRRRYLNARATIETLLQAGVIPIINENDTVATDEIRFGDNDRMAAQVGAMMGADILFLLSDIDGLYTANPRLDEDAKHLPEIRDITAQIEAMAGDTGTEFSKGGMKTKLMAARTALRAGMIMSISKGDVLHPITALRNGARASWFLPKEIKQAARKDWISSLKIAGAVMIDQGALDALYGGKSLLAAGVREVKGEFERGDAVAIIDLKGDSVASGLTSYSSFEIAKIMGKKTAEIESILGYPARSALIHRDDMVI